jgi:hypothetical protein
MKKEIEKIMVEGIGGVWAGDEEIVSFLKRGDSGWTRWYKKGNRHFQGKYIIEIEYKK